MSHLDPRTSLRESEVKRILDDHNVADSMPDAFADIDKVTRSYIPAANMPARLEVPSKGHCAEEKSIAIKPGGGVAEVVAP